VPPNELPAAGPDFMAVGGQDQRCQPRLRVCRGSDRPLAERPDVLPFQTDALAEDTEVTGPLRTRFWVSSSAVDTDFTARLIDVYPPSADYPEGYALLIAEGILRLRYRDDRPVGEPITPGDVYEISIELQPTSNVFKRGHRIRLDVSSSAFPQYDVNPNTGEPLGRHTRTLVAHQTVFHDAERASHLVLPIYRPDRPNEGEQR
jgi:putative CocE/NonD family hydrolase